MVGGWVELGPKGVWDCVACCCYHYEHCENTEYDENLSPWARCGAGCGHLFGGGCAVFRRGLGVVVLNLVVVVNGSYKCVCLSAEIGWGRNCKEGGGEMELNRFN